MNSLNYVFVLIVLVFGIFLYRLTKLPLLDMCEMEKCPYCYGTDFCDQFKQNSITVSEISIFDLVANYIGVKNVFYAHYKSSSIVLKKLGHNFELAKLDRQICADNNASGDNCDLFKLTDTQDYINKIICFLNSSGADEVRHFKICSTSAAEKFLNLLLDVYSKHLASGSRATLLKNVWTILQVNAEPLLMQLLKSEDNWPVPRYLGACGRIVVESYCGLSLNAFASADWNTRASLALQLLEAVMNFTERHADFRFYLTDISPDNIAVSSELKVAFVDLENAIVVSRDASESSDRNNEEIKQLREALENREKIIEKQELKINKLQETVNKQERRIYTLEKEIKKRNLVCYGVEEEPNEAPESTKRKFIQLLNSIEITVNADTGVEKVIRLGEYKEGKKRPMLAVLTSWNIKREILKNAKKLKGTMIWLSNDVTQKEQEEKKILIQYCKATKEKGYRPRIWRNKLMINNEEYGIEDLEANENPGKIENEVRQSAAENETISLNEAEENKKRNRSTDDEKANSTKKIVPKKKNYTQTMLAPMRNEISHKANGELNKTLRYITKMGRNQYAPKNQQKGLATGQIRR